MKIALRLLLVGVVTVLVFAVAGVIATWAPDRPVAALTARWAAPPSQFIEVAGMRVHLRDEGPRDDPSPIILLHGTSASLHTWDGWVEALMRERRVIRFDLPAFGLTGPNAQDDYSFAAYAQFVLAVLDKLGVQRCVLAGNSLGGQIATATAFVAPARVERLILVDSSGYPIESISVPLGFRIARLPGLRRVMEYTLPRGIIERSIKNVYGDPAKVTPALVDRYYELTLREGNRRALGRRMAQGYASNAEQIKTLRQPTLVLWGGQDRLIPPANAQLFGRDIVGAKVVVFDALGHVPHEEDPKNTVAEVRAFLGL